MKESPSKPLFNRHPIKTPRNNDPPQNSHVPLDKSTYPRTVHLSASPIPTLRSFILKSLPTTITISYPKVKKIFIIIVSSSFITTGYTIVTDRHWYRVEPSQKPRTIHVHTRPIPKSSRFIGSGSRCDRSATATENSQEQVKGTITKLIW